MGPDPINYMLTISDLVLLIPGADIGIFLTVPIKLVFFVGGTAFLLTTGMLLIRKPYRGVVLLPVITLLFPHFGDNLTVSLNANLVLLILITIALFWNDRVYIPRRYLATLTVLIAAGLFAGMRMIFEYSFSKTVLSFGYFFQWLLYITLPIIIVSHLTSLSPERRQAVKQTVVIAIFAASGVIVIHLLTVQLDLLPAIAGGEKVTLGGRRLRTFWAQGPNVVGFFLVIQILLTGAFALSLTLRKRYYIACGGYILLCGSLLPFTYSRSALVALVTGGLVFTLVRPRVIIPPVVFTCITAIMMLPANIQDRYLVNLFKYHYIQPLGQSLPVGPLHKRIALWISHLQRFNEQLILGNGFFVTHMDNTYLTLLVGSGVVGLMLTLYLFAQFITDCVGTFLCCRIENNRFNSGLALGTVAIFVGFLSWGLFSEVFARWRILGIIFLLIGLTLEQGWRPLGTDTA